MDPSTGGADEAVQDRRLLKNVDYGASRRALGVTNRCSKGLNHELRRHGPCGLGR